MTQVPQVRGSEASGVGGGGVRLRGTIDKDLTPYKLKVEDDGGLCPTRRRMPSPQLSHTGHAPKAQRWEGAVSPGRWGCRCGRSCAHVHLLTCTWRCSCLTRCSEKHLQRPPCAGIARPSSQPTESAWAGVCAPVVSTATGSGDGPGRREAWGGEGGVEEGKGSI